MPQTEYLLEHLLNTSKLHFVECGFYLSVCETNPRNLKKKVDGSYLKMADITKTVNFVFHTKKHSMCEDSIVKETSNH